MEMTKKSKPEFIQLFENLIWAHSPKDWILNSTYFQETLFISMSIDISETGQYKKIHRSFKADMIRNRIEDLWGLSQDCVDEMKTELDQ